MTTLAMVVAMVAMAVHSMATVVHTTAAMAVHPMAMVARTMVAMAAHPMATAVHTMVITAMEATDPTWLVSHVLNACFRLEAKDKGRATIMVTTMMMTIMAIITILITIPLATVTDPPTMAAATTTTIEPCPLSTPQKRIRLQEMGMSRRW